MDGEQTNIESGGAVQGDQKYDRSGWSWGAFTLGPIFLLGIRRYLLLIPYLLVIIPFAGLFVYLAYSIFMGVSGRSMARESRAFANRDQYVGFMKAIDHAGLIAFFLHLALMVLFAVLALTVVASLGEARGRAQDAAERQRAAQEEVERMIEDELGPGWNDRLVPVDDQLMIEADTDSAL